MSIAIWDRHRLKRCLYAPTAASSRSDCPSPSSKSAIKREQCQIYLSIVETQPTFAARQRYKTFFFCRKQTSTKVAPIDGNARLWPLTQAAVARHVSGVLVSTTHPYFLSFDAAKELWPTAVFFRSKKKSSFFLEKKSVFLKKDKENASFQPLVSVLWWWGEDITAPGVPIDRERQAVFLELKLINQYGWACIKTGFSNLLL